MLEFEQDILPIEARIDELRRSPEGSAKETLREVERLEKELHGKLARTYRQLDSWQTCQVARHPARPYTADYIKALFSPFHELHGDRMHSDDRALIGGLGRFQGKPVMVLGTQKGRDTDERIRHNFGMPHPEGYRKALRIMRLAEKFGVPLVTMIDTPGAFCGVEAEERNMSQAIGMNLLAMASLRTRIVAVVIGEGGSGGALAIGVGDCLLMLEHAVYSVISPEGCASILWKGQDGGGGQVAEAANAMRMQARQLAKLGLVDGVVDEPLGGAHRDPAAAARLLGEALGKALDDLRQTSVDNCLDQRATRLRDHGFWRERRR